MRGNLVILTFAVLLLSNCNKKEPLPDVPDDDPVFFLEAKLNGSPIQFQAGNNDYYMHTSFEKNENNLYVFKGDLRPNCSGNCGYSFSMLINDYRLSAANTQLNIDSAVHTGVYYFNNRTNWPTTQDVALVPAESEQPDVNYKWKIIDDKGVVVLSIIKSYSLVTKLETNKTYTVIHSSEDAPGICSPTLTSVFSTGNIFHTVISVTRTNTTVNFVATPDGTGTYTYDWDFADGSRSTAQNPSHQFSIDTNYIVKLTVKNEKNESCVVFYQVNTSNNIPCEANFKTIFYPLDYSKIYKTITLLLTDPSGKIYSTEFGTQLTGDIANVSEVSTYDQRNSAGKLTKKIKFNFNCVLKGDAGEIRLSDATAVMGVAFE